MADKELLDRIASAVEDAEATSDEELEWVAGEESYGQLGRSGSDQDPDQHLC